MSRQSNQHIQDERLFQLLSEERNLTAKWYQHMSLGAWPEGERQRVYRRFDELSIAIKERQGEIAAEQFAALPY